MDWVTQDDCDLSRFLAVSRVIDHDTPAVREMARELAQAAGPRGDEAVAERCFLFVRDRIRHSSDHHLDPVTLKASEVLEHGHGFCYAKSHLLCALLRANGIPAGLCYQRLRFDTIQSPFGLHGLNAVFLPVHGWYRIDARGNKAGVDARFAPPFERLAYSPNSESEADIPGKFTEPLPFVVDVLKRCRTWEEVLMRPPDLRPEEKNEGS
jgi:transglutaminase-like putative cysteine protease